VNGEPGEASGETPVPQRLAIVLPTTGRHDSRTARIARSLIARGHEVTVLARAAREAPAGSVVEDGVRFERVDVGGAPSLPLPARVLDRALAARRQASAARRVDAGADLYHAMAFLGLPVALDLGGRRGAPVVYDARDLYTEARRLARLPAPARWAMAARERSWARRAAGVATVNEALADQLAARLGVDRPTVVLNCPPRWNPGGPWPRRFHERLGLPAATRVTLYHGGLEPERGIEQLLDAAPLLPADAVVVLLGYGSLRDSIAGRIEADALLRGRAYVLDAVVPSELVGWVASADVAVAAIQPTTLNHRLTTPNKLFEALGAGVPVVASDFPGMAGIVTGDSAGPLGAVCDPTDPAAIAASIGAVLTLDVAAFETLRQRCLAAAHERYAWEVQVPRLLALYRRLTGRPW
jgi:glycosyltransferase involved in cell wall biosynthesis